MPIRTGDAPAVIDVAAPPGFLRHLVALSDWRAVQHAWAGIPTLAQDLAASQTPFDWDGLRLHLHRLISQFPFPSDSLPPAAKSLLVTLVHRRLDMALEVVTQARAAQQAYHAGSPAVTVAPAFGPMEAMKALEQHVVELQKAQLLPPITKAIYARVIGDANLEMLSRLHAETPAAARLTIWPVLCEWVLALSYCSDPVELGRLSLVDAVTGVDPLKLLHDTIRGNPPLKVAEAAARIAERVSDAAAMPALVTLLNGRYPNHLRAAIADALQAIGDATAAAHLIRLVLAETPDEVGDGMPYVQVRVAALAAVAAIAGRDASLQEMVVPALRQVGQRETLNPLSRLQAYLMLARHFQNAEGFDYAARMVVEAAVRQYAEIRDLAAEALAAMGNTLALNQLIEALQHTNRAETSLERFRPLGADRPEALLSALRSFGLEMHWNPSAQRWMKGPELLPGG